MSLDSSCLGPLNPLNKIGYFNRTDLGAVVGGIPQLCRSTSEMRICNRKMVSQFQLYPVLLIFEHIFVLNKTEYHLSPKNSLF